MPRPSTAAVLRRLSATHWLRRLGPVGDGAKKLALTLIESRAVKESGRYVTRELVRPTTASYSIRNEKSRVWLRHRTGDIEIFRKFYVYRYYDFPGEVLSTLSGLGRPLRVLDLGANIGLFGAFVQQRFSVAHSVAFEPDTDNVEVLELLAATNLPSLEIVRACAANYAGVARFAAGRQNLSRIDSHGEMTVPTVDVFPYVAAADLVKMNIEGSEWEILQDPRFATTSACWIIEYHRIGNPDPDIHRVVRELCESAGYRTLGVMEHPENGLLWAWRDSSNGGPPS